MPKKIDLTGQKFGRLTVTGEAPRSRSSKGTSIVNWYCTCNCGNTVIVRSSSLLGKKTVSCGCWNLEKAKFPKLYNRKVCTYDLTGEHGKGWTSKGDEFWFDKEDYDLIKDYSWHVHHKYLVASGNRQGQDGKEIFMHRLIMDNPNKKYDVDHICTERKFDNRKCNLRIVNRSQNNSNKVIQKNNTSGVPGVKKSSKSKGKWEAFININKKCTYLGTYADFDEAVAVRKAAEEKYYGEYSYDNSQKIAKGL